MNSETGSEVSLKRSPPSSPSDIEPPTKRRRVEEGITPSPGFGMAGQGEKIDDSLYR